MQLSPYLEAEQTDLNDAGAIHPRLKFWIFSFITCPAPDIVDTLDGFTSCWPSLNTTLPSLLCTCNEYIFMKA